MMLKVPIRRIGGIHMQQNTGLEYLDSFLPIKVVVTDEGGHAPFEILQPVLVVTTVTASLLVKVPKLCQFPDIIVIRGFV